MPHLDQRLKAVACQIRCGTHADIGSDHGHLLKALLASGRIERGIAIENKVRPHANSQATLAGCNADVRLADGLAGIASGEADCLSICGMGGESIVRILEAYPDRVPVTAILQPNRRPELVRAWALRSHYNLADERIAHGHWRYVILRFEKSQNCPANCQSHHDPAYDGLDRDAALLLGPHQLHRRDSDFITALREEQTYLRSLARLTKEATNRLAVIERVI
ncbi:tRNA (adenine(22)-N(1))-methyltransferase [Aporhodopirellula aestuarii]|uniref:Class I SAM-dependent methyltransferase n=1 Tax=Aporhodopirellula aestuarii TaxID=2950107 RepID=A0ABT0U5K7_9BACT|nr:class I SAM-dependent methyltransferase [Aporhodopirellula aestuarii]MCM2372200.1 class I SAM-dependent methyltransferase [Aporhodopirellula aestuarii]